MGPWRFSGRRKVEDEGFPDPSPASDLYSEMVNGLIKAEDARKASIEQRGIAVISLSGALVTILLGTMRAAPSSAVSQALLLVALVFLAAAAALALFATTPKGYAEVEDAYLDELLTEFWDEPEIIATRRIGSLQIGMLKAAREVTTRKARLLQAAVLAELTAIGLLAGCASIVISSR